MGISLNPSLVAITDQTLISGTVIPINKFLDDFGNPVPGSTVIAFPLQDSSLAIPLFQGTVNADGTFSLNVPTAGTYQVQLAGSGLSKVRTVFFPDLQIVSISGLTPITDQSLDISSVVLGPILTPGGQPIIGCEVQLFASTDITLSNPMSDPAYSGGDGTFRVYGVPGHTFTVCFSATGFQRYTRTVSI